MPARLMPLGGRGAAGAGTAADFLARCAAMAFARNERPRRGVLSFGVSFGVASFGVASRFASSGRFSSAVARGVVAAS